jgi:hypothetical protein
MKERVMGANTANDGWPSDGVLRAVVWGAAALLYLVPVVAYQFTNLPWTAEDFVAWAVMLGGAGGIFELGMRLSRENFYRAAMAIAAGASFLLVWVHMAVQIIDVEQDWAMLMFFAPLLIGALGGLAARFKAEGMAMTLLAMAMVQLLIGVLAYMVSPTQPEGWIFSACLAAAWFTSSQLFRVAARRQA